MTSVGLLDRLRGPTDLRGLPAADLPALAEEIRQRLISQVCRCGGHLGPNLGVVELTIALHRCFDSPRDAIVWDTGHQSYVHKMLTGRQHRLSALRTAGGLSGYPSRSESPHDLVENSHASTAVVLNDNGRSYAPTVGVLARHLAALRSGDSSTNLFRTLGFQYVGPVDGHDVSAVEKALRTARGYGVPVIVHCLTRKGCGYAPAEGDEADCLHTVPKPLSSSPPSGPLWTDVFGRELADIATRDSRVVAITAAMLRPTGLLTFAQAFPDRVYDVGIAEQHAVTSAAGLAMAGMKPVVAVYSTFLNRAFVTIEDNAASGGFGAGFARSLRAQGLATPLLTLALADGFVPAAERSAVHRQHGLDAVGIAQQVREHACLYADTRTLAVS